MQTSPQVIACVDVGAPQRGNVGWAVLYSGELVHGTDLHELARVLSVHVAVGRTLALGFECPLYVPRRADPMAMTRARMQETGVNWCGGPGGSVLATGLVQVNWVLRQLRHASHALVGTTRWAEFCSGGANLFLWEAFITSRGGFSVPRNLVTVDVRSTHARDAICGVIAFDKLTKQHATLPSDLGTENAISLVAMNLLESGVSNDQSLLSEPCIVLRVLKPS
jgi:hypothetical protein